MTVVPTATQSFVREQMRLLGLRLQREVNLVRAARAAEGAGRVAVPEEGHDGIREPLWPLDSADGDLEREIADLEAELRRRREASPDLPIGRLERVFGLSATASDLVLLLLASALDERFARVFAHLHGDPARRWLTPGLACRLLGLQPESQEVTALFSADGPLLRHEIVQVTTTEHGVPLPPPSRPLTLEDRIYAELLEQEGIDARLEGLVTLVPPMPNLGPEQFEPEVRAPLVNLLGLLERGTADAAWFRGQSGAGKESAARYLAAASRRPLLVVEARALPQSVAAAQPVWRALLREQRLRNALVYVRRFDLLAEELRTALEPGAGMLVGVEESPGVPAGDQARLELHFSVPEHAGRRQRWLAELTGATAGPEALAEELAGRFRLTPGQIEQAAHAARQLAWLRDGPGARPTSDDYFEGARRQSSSGLELLASKVSSPHTWDDLVLPAGPLAQLRALVSQVRHAPLVYDTWGFGKKLAHGKGLTALFSGPSGTGKTMSAGIIARALGLDMYKIDLSGVVSKYIGETEKNLEKVFSQAITANAVLFFDEADALFGKRSEVKDAHDRYANIEISYLLQKMDDYQGVAILATNLGQNMDEAFTRRLQFVIEFPFPGPPEREAIWRGHFPPEAPLGSDVDFGFLGTQFELSGGNIRSCVLGAAFAAAEAGETIGMNLMIQAVAREMSKLGKPRQRAAFGEYFPLVAQAYRWPGNGAPGKAP